MNRMKWIPWMAATVSALTFATGAQAATWTESDAGGTLATAELVDATATPGVSIDRLFGALSNTIDAVTNVLGVQTDLYRIYIGDTTTFSATTDTLGNSEDTRLFLFDSTGHGIEANDDSDGGVFSTLSAGSLAGKASGYYYLGVGLSLTVAYGQGDAELFGATSDAVTDPSLTLVDFGPNTFSQADPALAYAVDMTGVLATATAVPEPGSWGLLAAGLAFIGVRRRRSA